MKKFMKTLIMLIMATCLWACGGGDVKTTEAPGEESNAEREDNSAAAKNTSDEAGENISMSAPEGDLYTLTKIGSFLEPKDGYMSLHYDIPLKVTSEEQVVVNWLGEEVISYPYDGMAALGDGFVWLMVEQDDPNCGAVVVIEDGTVLCENVATARWISDRYLQVVYATEPTTDENECYFYTTDAMISLGPDEGSKMYKGYAKIYDVANRQFVDGIQIDNTYAYPKVCGDAICLAKRSDMQVYSIYDGNGTLLGTTERGQIGDGFILELTGAGFKVYDDTMKEIATIDASYDIKVLTGTNQYVRYTDSNTSLRGVMDLQGNVVLEAKYEDVYEMVGPNFIVEKDGMQGLVTAAGKEVYGFSKGNYFTSVGYGFCWTNAKDGNYDIITPWNAVIHSNAIPSDTLVIQDSKTGKGLVLSEERFVLDVSYYGEKFALGIGADANNKYGLCDTMSGNMLLENAYDNIIICGDYVYAKQGETWTVYALSVNWQ